MDKKALHKLTYGLYLLSARDGGRDNACIINTAVQAANSPVRITVAVSKDNLTHDMVLSSGIFNLSAITADADFSLFERFGLQSGRSADKFDGFTAVRRSENGLYYLAENSAAFMSLRVTDSLDLGSHTLIVGELTDAGVLSDKAPCTYAYYQSDIKKKAPAQSSVKKGWRCSVCGYVYEGEHLPEDFVCPLCKHGAEDFVYFEETAEPAPKSSKTFVCTVCGYVHEGPEPPEKCPICQVPASMFEEKA